MRTKRQPLPLSSAAVRRLKPIAPVGAAPTRSSTLFSTVVSSRAAPTITTEVRPFGQGQSRAWQVTVTTPLAEAFSKPVQFAKHRVRRPRHRPSTVIVTDAHRPPWVGFTPRPRTLRRLAAVQLYHHGQRVTPLKVIPPYDNRQVYRDWTYPWGLVCYIQSGSGDGSGVLVGPRHVLTASHVVDWNAGWAMVEVQTFDKTFSSGSCVASLHAFTKIANVTSSTLDEDYAVLVLFDRLGDQFGWMGSRTYDSAWDDKTWWYTMGYPDEIGAGRRPVFEKDFHLDEDEFDLGSGRAMTCGADLTQGQSGSPIFGFWRSTPYVVAVVSAESSSENYCAGGSDLPRLVKKVRDAFP
jgi:V8-like Glu-specific endopeptidase